MELFINQNVWHCCNNLYVQSTEQTLSLTTFLLRDRWVNINPFRVGKTIKECWSDLPTAIQWNSGMCRIRTLDLLTLLTLEWLCPKLSFPWLWCSMGRYVLGSNCCHLLPIWLYFIGTVCTLGHIIPSIFQQKYQLESLGSSAEKLMDDMAPSFRSFMMKTALYTHQFINIGPNSHLSYTSATLLKAGWLHQCNREEFGLWCLQMG